MKKIVFLILACLIVAGCEKPKPDPQPSTPHIDWAPEATAAQREMIVGMLHDMVYVEGGTFYMGVQCTFPAMPCFDSTTWYEQTPVHLVTLSPYMIGRYEVTIKQWYLVMGDGTGTDGHYTLATASLPIDDIALEQIDTFFARIEHLSGLRFRLPTEAEWEYAARGGAKGHDGNRFSGAYYKDDVAWVYQNSHQQTHPVGTKKPNELGLYDMSGNGGELCSDIYAPYPAEAQFDPQGPAYWEDNMRVVRGGNCGSNDQTCRLYYRSHVAAPYSGLWVGLRVACMPFVNY